jgi:hypothetical protein
VVRAYKRRNISIRNEITKFSSKFERLRFAICRDSFDAGVGVRYVQRGEWSGNLVSNTAHIVQFTLCDLCSRTYTKYIQLHIFMHLYSTVCICAAIVDITTINARYTANLVPNTAHIHHLLLCDLWSRTYTIYLQLRIFRLQYSGVGICSAIVHIT